MNILSQRENMKKRNRKILNQKENMKYTGNLQRKKNMKTTNMREIFNQKENVKKNKY